LTLQLSRQLSSRRQLAMIGVMTTADEHEPIDWNAPRAWRVTITIADIAPPIWRTLLVPESFNFAQMHELIQAAFGWTDSHLHHFILGGLVVGAPEFDDERETLEAEEIRLSQLRLYPLEDPKILYEYDFGDSWRHWIAFERMVAMKKGETYPQLIDGARARPPEDVGGPHGYQDFLEAWRNPKHEDHKANRTWAGRSYDPEAFDIEKTQKAIRSALRRCKGGYRFRLEP
jgi:hypothetical protein